MDKCKLCGEHPISYVFDGVTRYHCPKKFKENSCPNSRTDFTPEQWAALMGDDALHDMREKVIRYRNAVEVLAYTGVFRDAPALIADIESGAFDDEYEIVKAAAIGQPLPLAPEQEIEGEN